MKEIIVDTMEGRATKKPHHALYSLGAKNIFGK